MAIDEVEDLALALGQVEVHCSIAPRFLEPLAGGSLWGREHMFVE
jgi:hypothetical protein